MPPLSVLEYRGTSAKSDMNVANIGAYTRSLSDNLRNRARLAVMSAALKQNAIVRDIIGRESLITRREGQLKQLDDQLAQYYGEFGSVLNGKALDFLNKMADINVPTFTSILAGFENARASRADMEMKRITDMERIMNLDANLQKERMALRREQIDAEQMVGQAQLKSMDEVYAGQMAGNQEAFKMLQYSGTWDPNPQGQVLHAPQERVEVIYDRGGSTGTRKGDAERAILREKTIPSAQTTQTQTTPARFVPGGAYILNEYFGNGAVNNNQEEGIRALSYLDETIRDLRNSNQDSLAHSGTVDDYEILRRFGTDQQFAKLGQVLGLMRGNILGSPQGPGTLRSHFLEAMGGNQGGQAERFLNGLDFNKREDVVEGLKVVFDKLRPHSSRVRNANAGTAVANEGAATGQATSGSIFGIPENRQKFQSGTQSTTPTTPATQTTAPSTGTPTGTPTNQENNKAQQPQAATTVTGADVAYSGPGMTTTNAYDQSTGIATPVVRNPAMTNLFRSQEEQDAVDAAIDSITDEMMPTAMAQATAEVTGTPDVVSNQDAVGQETIRAFTQSGQRMFEEAQREPQTLVYRPDGTYVEPETLVYRPDGTHVEPTPIVANNEESSVTQPTTQSVLPQEASGNFISREWNRSRGAQAVQAAVPEWSPSGTQATLSEATNTEDYARRADTSTDPDFVREALNAGYTANDIGNVLRMNFPPGYDRMAYLRRAAIPEGEPGYWATTPYERFAEGMAPQFNYSDEFGLPEMPEVQSEAQAQTQPPNQYLTGVQANQPQPPQSPQIDWTQVITEQDLSQAYPQNQPEAQAQAQPEAFTGASAAQIEAQLNADRVPPTRIDIGPLQVERPWYDPNVSSTYRIGMDTSDVRAPVRVAAGRIPGDNRIVRLTDANGNFYDVPASMLRNQADGRFAQPRQQRHWSVLNDEDARLREAGGINLDRVNAIFESMMGGMTPPNVYQPTQGTIPNTPYRLWDAGQLPTRIFDARDPSTRTPGERPTNPVLQQVNPRAAAAGQAAYDAVIAQGGSEEEATAAGMQVIDALDSNFRQILTASAYGDAMADVPAANQVYMTNAGLQRQAQGQGQWSNSTSPGGRSARGVPLTSVTGIASNVDVYNYSGGQRSWDGTHSLMRDRFNRFADIAGQYGVRIPLVTAHRDPKWQNDLYAQGRTKAGKVVTWVRGGGSNHQAGMALDTDVNVIGEGIMANPQLRDYAIQKYGKQYGRNYAFLGVIDEWAAQAGLQRPMKKKDPSHLELVQDDEYHSRVNHARYMADKGRWNGAAAYEIGQSAPPKMTQTQVKQAQARTTGQKPLNKGMSVNNPFNLRTIEYVRPGEVKNTRRDFQGFGAFKDLMSGVTAGVHSVIARNIIGRNTDTIRKFVNTYLGVDPRTGTNGTNDNPEQYMRNLEQATGLRRDDPIDITNEQLMLNLLGMVAQTETGSRNYIGVDNLRTAYRKVMSDIGRRINSAQRGQGRRTAPVTREQLRRDARTMPM